MICSMAPDKGAKMEQKKNTHAARLEPADNIQVEAVKQLL
jgi:hypothetical protein